MCIYRQQKAALTVQSNAAFKSTKQWSYTMIFDIAALNNQIAKLTAERDRKAQQNATATALLTELADLIDELDEDAIATLKSEILALFPTPQSEAIPDTPDEECETISQQDFEAIPDTPDEKLEETISQRVAQAKGEYYQLIATSNPALAYLKRRDGQLGCTYLGGMNQSRLAAWGDWLHANGYTTHPPTLREAKRLGNWTYELKLPPMPISYLEELVATDYTRYPSMPRFNHSVLAA
jgi:hypothetical protein